MERRSFNTGVRIQMFTFNQGPIQIVWPTAGTNGGSFEYYANPSLHFLLNSGTNVGGCTQDIHLKGEFNKHLFFDILLPPNL